MWVRHLDELLLDGVVHQVDALPLLAVVEVLLRDVQWVFRLRQRLLQDALGALQRLHLRQHVVRLVVHLVLPELDVADALAERLADVGLRALRLVVHLAHQARRVVPHAFRPAAHAVRRHVVAAARREPVVRRVARVERIARRREHRRHLDAVELRQPVAARHRLGHAALGGYRRLDAPARVVDARSPRQRGERAAQRRRRRVRVVRLVRRLHRADRRQEGGALAARQVRTRHVRRRLRLAHVIHIGWSATRARRRASTGGPPADRQRTISGPPADYPRTVSGPSADQPRIINGPSADR